MDLKKQVFKELDRNCPSHTIITSNTSGLSLTEMISEFRRKGQVVIAHWWNPPHIIPCVEVIKSQFATDEVFHIVIELLEWVGKKPVRV
jgi:3-hydroxybutyryl-CoA dehydrogenase